VKGGAAAEPAGKAPDADTPKETKPIVKESMVPSDPFAALEAHSTKGVASKPKGKVNATAVNEADAFLSQLEQDLLSSKLNKW